MMVLFCLALVPVFSQDIYTAVAEGNVELTRHLLEKDPGLINLRNPDMLTPLNLASERGQVEVAALLLKMGADPSIGDRENSQPIHLAAVSGSIPIVDILVEKGVDIDTKDINLMTPLLFASSRGNVEMIRHLIDLGADVKAANNRGMTVLHMATIAGNVDLLTLLVDHGARVNITSENGITPLHSAASYGRTQSVKFLVEHGADIEAETDEGEPPLSWAAGRNSLGAAQYLVSMGADVNHRSKDGSTALHNVAGRGTISIADFLVENGADVNASTPGGFVPLTSAAWAANGAEMAKFLILNGAEVNPDPCRNNKDCTCSPNFRTPLHAACDVGNLEMIEVLVNNGAKVNLLSNDGMTPLKCAVKSGNFEAVKFLVDHGAFLNVREQLQGSTELHMAAAMGYGDMTQFLLEKGSCPDIMDNNGKTPLDYAFYYGQNRIGYEMLAAGADDNNLAGYLNAECPLAESLGPAEAEVFFLGQSAWAVKTQNHLLVFDYSENARVRKPDHPCILSGCIDTAELKRQKLAMFFTHEHADHFSPSIFTLQEAVPGTEFVLCFNPAGSEQKYTYIPLNGEAELNGMKIYVIKSTDAGGGYLIEVDGLVIFHMGDHANGDEKLMPGFTNEIDMVAEKNKDIDIMFGPTRGCSLGSPEQVRAGTYYAIDKLHPALFVPMHAGDYTFAYKEFVEKAREDGLTQPMVSVINKGDRFHYSKPEASAVSER